MKTIAHCRALYGGLSETFIYTLVRGIRNFRPIVLAERSYNAELFPTPDLFVAPRYRWSPLSVARALMRRLGWRTNPWVTSRVAMRTNLFYERVIRQEQACLLHAHFGPEGVRLLPLTQRLQLPLVTTFYGYDMSQLGRDAAWREAYRELFKLGSLFLIEGPHMQQQLVELGCPPEKVFIQPIPIDLTRYLFRERTPETEGRIRLLYCGRFVEKKGLDYALRALAAAIRCYPDFHLRVIGDGDLRKHIEVLIAELNLGQNVTLLGYRTHAETIAEMQRAHILVQPSVTASDGDSEGGAPTVLLEAQAIGLPVLATTHADIPFVVGQGAGLLAAERDVEQLSANLLQLATAPNSWPLMGRAGRQHVERQHDVNMTTSQLERHYERLLKYRPLQGCVC